MIFGRIVECPDLQPGEPGDRGRSAAEGQDAGLGDPRSGQRDLDRQPESVRGAGVGEVPGLRRRRAHPRRDRNGDPGHGRVCRKTGWPRSRAWTCRSSSTPSTTPSRCRLPRSGRNGGTTSRQSSSRPGAAEFRPRRSAREPTRSRTRRSRQVERILHRLDEQSALLAPPRPHLRPSPGALGEGMRACVATAPHGRGCGLVPMAIAQLHRKHWPPAPGVAAVPAREARRCGAIS